MMEVTSPEVKDIHCARHRAQFFDQLSSFDTDEYAETMIDEDVCVCQYYTASTDKFEYRLRSDIKNSAELPRVRIQSSIAIDDLIYPWTSTREQTNLLINTSLNYYRLQLRAVFELMYWSKLKAKAVEFIDHELASAHIEEFNGQVLSESGIYYLIPSGVTCGHLRTSPHEQHAIPRLVLLDCPKSFMRVATFVGDVQLCVYSSAPYRVLDTRIA